jgi:hypothetical protein
MTNWFDSLVQIRLTNGEKGSGIFISPTEVLTAAHVVAATGVSSALGELVVDIRFQSRLATARRIGVLPAWIASRTTGSDVALIGVDAEQELGIRPLFGVPAAHASAMLEGHGFVAQTDAEQTLSGSVRSSPPTPEEPFLFSEDISPLPGMSGGPLLTSINGAVRVAGILTQRAENHFVGLAMLESVIATLRAHL